MASTDVTVAEVDELASQILIQEEKIAIKEDELKELNKELMKLEGRAVSYLTALNRDEYMSPAGKLKIEKKWRVNMPADDIAKLDLFNYLRELGIFEKYATVNSNSLNALYMSFWNEAKSRGEGVEFSMPGIAEPKLFEKLNFKPTKK